MPTMPTKEMRDWARDNGYEIPDRGAIRADLYAEIAAGYNTNGSDRTVPDPPAEPKPKPKRAKLRGRLWGAEPSTETTPATPTSERAPKAPAHRRISIAELCGGFWRGAGKLCERSVDLPVGRAIQLESDAAGLILDEALKGTLVDRVVLQPIARRGDSTKKIWALITFPVAIGAMERNPAAYQAMLPIVRSSLIVMLPDMLRALKQAKKDEADLADALSGMAPMFGLPDGTPVSVDDVLGWLFPRVAEEEGVAA